LLGVLLCLLVIWNFVKDCSTEDVLISKHVAHFAFIYGHALLVCPVKGLALMSVPVLDIVVLFF
jgi:hypothetical protein